jgi:hypothetical protein
MQDFVRAIEADVTVSDRGDTVVKVTIIGPALTAAQRRDRPDGVNVFRL